MLLHSHSLSVYILYKILSLYFFTLYDDTQQRKKNVGFNHLNGFAFKPHLTSTFSCALSTRVWLKQNQKKWVSIWNTEKLSKNPPKKKKKTSFFFLILFSQVISVFLFIHLFTFQALWELNFELYIYFSVYFYAHTFEEKSKKLIFNALCSDYTF